MPQPTVTLPHETEIQAAWREKYKSLARYESNDGFWFAAGYRAALDAPQAAPDMVEENDKAVGKKWREDSRLEEWFPITAEKLAALEVEVHKLRMRHPLGEAVAWRRWNNKWHEYDYAGSPQLDGGSLFDWEPLAAVPRAALDAPATVDCRGCKHHRAGLVGTGCYVSLDTGKPVRCTNFDKFQALPPISLTKVTK